MIRQKKGLLTAKGYTKHYFEEGRRVCSKIGGGHLDVIQSQSNWDGTGKPPAHMQEVSDRLFKESLKQVYERVLMKNDPDCITEIYEYVDELHHPIDGIPERVKAEVAVKLKDFRNNVRDMRGYLHDERKNVYYYHSDHLGSASWKKERFGKPFASERAEEARSGILHITTTYVQHLQYLPYGEPYIDQRAAGTTYSERFRFTGKERDEETGYGYFGARYMDHELMTMWLSVDPMADKYPSISPYAYCAWNPIRLIDPDGREMNPVYNYKGILLGCTNEGFTGKIIIYDGENTSFEGMSSDDFVSANYSAEYYDMDNECRLDNVAKESMYRNILSNYDGTDINGYTFYQQDITFNFDKEKSGNYSVNPYLDHFLLNVSEKYLTYQDVIYDGQDAILFRGGHYDASVENIAASIIYHEWYGHYCNKWTEKGGTHYKCYEAVRDCPFFQKCTPEYRDDVLQQIINMK